MITSLHIYVQVYFILVNGKRDDKASLRGREITGGRHLYYLKTLLTSLFQREEYNLHSWKKGDCFALLAITIFYPGMWNLVPLDVLPVSV